MFLTKTWMSWVQNKCLFFPKIDLLQSYTSIVQPMQDKSLSCPTFYSAKITLKTYAILISFFFQWLDQNVWPACAKWLGDDLFPMRLIANVYYLWNIRLFIMLVISNLYTALCCILVKKQVYPYLINKSLFSIKTIYQHCFGDHYNKGEHTTIQWLSKALGFTQNPWVLNQSIQSIGITYLCSVSSIAW